VNKTQLARKVQGLCPYCGNAPEEGKTLCAVHLADGVRRAMKRWHNGGREVQQRRENARRVFLQDYKTQRGCEVCGEVHPAVLDFHHRDPSQKEFSLANMVGRTWESMLAEVDKCSVLCANCHRKLHWNARRGHGTEGSAEA